KSIGTQVVFCGKSAITTEKLVVRKISSSEEWSRLWRRATVVTLNAIDPDALLDPRARFRHCPERRQAALRRLFVLQESLPLACRVNSRQRSTSVAFGAKRASTELENGASAPNQLPPCVRRSTRSRARRHRRRRARD